MKRLARRSADAIRAELTDALNTEKYEKLESYHRVKEAKKKALAPFTEEEQLEAAEAV